MKEDRSEMKASRSILYENLPLFLPYSIQIFPSYICNFKCNYCIQSIPIAQRGYISNQQFLDYALFQELVDDIASTGASIRKLVFVGMGEPLLHPKIAEMVAYASHRKIADSIDIVTNATALTQGLSERLIDANLTYLRVSINGLSTEEYFQNTSSHISFSKIVSNIRYFYEHCPEHGTQVYTKILDYMLEGNYSEREKLFHEIFDPISHQTDIEHLHPQVADINYDKIKGNSAFSKTHDGLDMQKHCVCPQPFWKLQLNPDGTFVPCCAAKYPLVLRPAHAKVSAIWNSAELTRFRLSLLSHCPPQVCRECELFGYLDYPEDILDGHEDDLIDKYQIFLHRPEL